MWRVKWSVYGEAHPSTCTCTDTDNAMLSRFTRTSIFSVLRQGRCPVHVAASRGWIVTRAEMCGRVRRIKSSEEGIGDRVRKKPPMGCTFTIADVLPRALVLQCIALARFFLATHQQWHFSDTDLSCLTTTSQVLQSSGSLSSELYLSIIESVCPTIPSTFVFLVASPTCRLPRTTLCPPSYSYLLLLTLPPDRPLFPSTPDTISRPSTPSINRYESLREPRADRAFTASFSRSSSHSPLLSHLGAK
ncbi:hypothetical protein ES702_00524 [subsurface metagenome]